MPLRQMIGLLVVGALLLLAGVLFAQWLAVFDENLFGTPTALVLGWLVFCTGLALLLLAMVSLLTALPPERLPAWLLWTVVGGAGGLGLFVIVLQALARGEISPWGLFAWPAFTLILAAVLWLPRARSLRAAHAQDAYLSPQQAP